MSFYFLVWFISVQRTVTFWWSYRIGKKFYKQLEEVLNWPLIFSINSGYYYFLAQSQLWFKIEKIRVFRWRKLLLSNRVSYCFISLSHWTFESERKKAIEARSVTSYRNRLPIYLSKYWWDGISNYVYSTILVITKIYVLILPYFTSVLIEIIRSQPTSIAWIVTSTAAFYHHWNFTEHSMLYIFNIDIFCPYEICIFIWFFDLINVNNTKSWRILNFAYLTVGYDNRCFISMKFGFDKKWKVFRNFVAGVVIFVDILIFLVFSKPGIQ